MKRDSTLSEIASIDRRVFLKCVGYPEEAIDRVTIGVVNTWGEVNHASINLDHVTKAVKAGVWAAGGRPQEFAVSSICSGMGGCEGGESFQLLYRDLVAGYIETIAETNFFDGLVFVPVCDDVIPAHLMAAARLNLPSVVVTGGYLPPNRYKGMDLDPCDVISRYYPQLKKGEITREEFDAIENIACVGGGACPAMGTANTMAAIAEALGMALPGNATLPGTDSRLLRLAFRAGEQVVRLHKKGIRPADIMTPDAFRNAIRVLLAVGGSTNAILHLQAIASELDLDIQPDMFNALSDETPFICDVLPSGSAEYNLRDLDGAGGIPAVMKELEPLLGTDVITVTGKPLGENLKDARIRDRRIIYPLTKPIAKEGGLVFLYGNLAPEGALIKRSAVPPEMYTHRGPARIFCGDREATDALMAKQILPGDTIIIRDIGPKGGPGMKIVYFFLRLLESSDLFKSVACVTDGRFSGYCRGCIIGHVTPEAAAGGPLAVVRDGDMIEIDIPNKKLNVDISSEELSRRLQMWKPPPPKAKKGVLVIYEKMANSAGKGAALNYKI